MTARGPGAGPATAGRDATDGGQDPQGPVLPLGRRVSLGRRGSTFVREVPGPPGAPTLLLLHGWVASGGMNWYQVFGPLGQKYRVIAPDLRGHARGLRTRRIFRLADCADDCAATLAELDTGPVIAVGYSMGGPVAQLLWRRHRDLVSGLVLAATAPGFLPVSRQRLAYQSWMLGVAAAARAASLAPGLPVLALGGTPRMMPTWVAAEMRRHDWRMVLEAGHSLSTFYSGRWINEIDVPTAVICTTEDRGVQPSLQRAMADAIPGARLHEIADGHLACARPSFAKPLIRACDEVADRSARISRTR
ncbi:MAG: alpha/beta fold hydrolase [Actinomycetota bacterium]